MTNMIEFKKKKRNTKKKSNRNIQSQFAQIASFGDIFGSQQKCFGIPNAVIKMNEEYEQSIPHCIHE